MDLPTETTYLPARGIRCSIQSQGMQRPKFLALLMAACLAQAGWARPLRPPSFGDPVNREFLDTELGDVIRFLAEAMGRNVYLGPGVEGRLTVSLRSVPPVAALHEVLASFSPNLSYKQIGKDTLIVAEPECRLKGVECEVRVKKHQNGTRHEFLLERAPAAKVIWSLQPDYPDVDFDPHPTLNGFYAVGSSADIPRLKLALPALDIASEPVDQVWEREFVQIRFADLEEVRSLLQTLIPDSRIWYDSRQSTLIIEGTAGVIQQVKELVDQLDCPLDQVLLECKLVPGTKAASSKFAVDWTGDEIRSTPKVPGLRFGRFRPLKVSSLTPFESASSPASLARSLLGARDGQSGELVTGDRAPGSDQPAVVLQISASPTLLEKGARVRCKLHGTFTVLTAPPAGGKSSVRVVNFDGEVELKDGETAILDGLLPAEVAVDAMASVPWLAELPIFGHLFRNIESHQSVYLMITPNVMR